VCVLLALIAVGASVVGASVVGAFGTISAPRDAGRTAETLLRALGRTPAKCGWLRRTTDDRG
jgi:hypothetical protein